MKRIAIFISGGGSNMVQLARFIARIRYAEVGLVLSNEPDAAGLSKARQLGLQTMTISHAGYYGDRSAFENEIHEALVFHRIDMICLAGFMRILTPSFVRRWHRKILNIHPSLLPKYPGLNTHQRAIEAGDDEAGCTVHWVTPELDAGPPLGRARVEILPNDTAESLAARVLRKEHILYPKVLGRVLAGGNLPVAL